MKKSYVFNTLICCGCTALIFLLHFIVYGGVLLEKPLPIGIICAVFIAAATGRIGGSREPWFPPNHIVTRLCQLIWCAALGTIPYVLCVDPYSLDNWIVFLLWIAVTVIELVHREDNSAAYSIAMVLALCVTGAFLLVVHPITVSQAQSIVEQAGYTDCVYYKVDADGNLAHEDGRPDGAIIYVPSPESAERSEYYAFSAVKGKKEYGILISRFRGTIDVEQKQGV